MNRSLKVLQVSTLDVTVKSFLLPFIDRLTDEGYDVHVACSGGRCVPEIEAHGVTVHAIPIERRIRPVSVVRALWSLYRLMKKEHFDIVHVHTPIAATLGRISAWAAGVPVVIYTVHGFYFHEYTTKRTRQLVILTERLLARITDLVLTVSQEDAVTAVNERICDREKLLWVSNGVDTRRFSPRANPAGARETLGLGSRDKLVCFIGRLVREKGVLDLIEAMRLVAKAIPDAKLLLVGDALDSDRDQKTKNIVAELLEQDDIKSHVLLAGYLEDIPRVLAACDVFVLPSYREGMPITVIEAMAAGKPVIATNIRGCREEVVPNLTGLLVPINDPEALANAIVALLSNPETARRMGAAGRKRACQLFDEQTVVNRQVQAYAEIAGKQLASHTKKELVYEE